MRRLIKKELANQPMSSIINANLDKEILQRTQELDELMQQVGQLTEGRKGLAGVHRGAEAYESKEGSLFEGEAGRDAKRDKDGEELDKILKAEFRRREKMIRKELERNRAGGMSEDTEDQNTHDEKDSVTITGYGLDVDWGERQTAQTPQKASPIKSHQREEDNVQGATLLRTLNLQGNGGVNRATPGQFPLYKIGGQQNPEYRPWGHSDMNAVLQKLPDLTKGGMRWLNKLTTLTHGNELAVGDFRALMGHLLTRTQMTSLEDEARIDDVANDKPLSQVITQISRALSRLYPTPKMTYQSIKFKIGAEESASAYLHRAEAEWEERTGQHPDCSEICKEFYRQAVIKGVPEKAAQQIENSPEMCGGSGETWVRYFIHYVDKAKEKQDREDSEVEKLKTQLLKLQIETEKEKNKKKPKEEVLQMPVMTGGSGGQEMSQGASNYQSQGPSGYPYDPQPDWPPPGNRWQNQNYKGNYGKPRRQQGCFLCGASDHWQRYCQLNREGQPPARGRAPVGGGPQGRGRGVPRNFLWSANQQVPRQSPVWDPAGHADC